TQTASGTYSLRIGPEVMTPAGTKMTVYTTTFQLTAPPVVTRPVITSATSSRPSANTLASVRVTFDQSVNPSTFSAADVALTGPSGQPIAVTGVKVVTGSRFPSTALFRSTQTASGTYSLRIGPEVMTPAGTKMTVYTTTFRLTAPTPA